MKNIFALTFFFLCFFSKNLYAQNNSIYQIEYLKYRTLDREKFLEHFGNAIDKAMVDKNWEIFSREETYLLWTNDEESIFQQVDRIDNNQSNSNEIRSGNSVVTYSTSNSQLYKNIKDQYTLLPESTMGKYLIQDALYKFDWNVDYNDTKNILGYEVKKATAKGLEQNTTVEVWYAPALKMSNGPYLYWGLPGLILEVNIDFDVARGLGSFIKTSHFKATKIDKVTLDKSKKQNKLNAKNRQIIKKEEYDKKIQEWERKQNEYNNQGVEK